MDDALKDRLKNDPHHTGTNAEARAAEIAREETSGIAPASRPSIAAAGRTSRPIAGATGRSGSSPSSSW